MKTKLLKQTVYEMKSQPIVALVTLIGTAFAIFLMMTVMMINNVRVMPMAPESNRDMMLYGMNFHNRSIIEGQNSDSSSRLNLRLAKTLYGGLDGIAIESYYTDDLNSIDAEVPGRTPAVLYVRYTDDKFWKIFDHSFIAGKPYDEAQVKAAAKDKVAVMSESSVREVLGCEPEKAVGQTIKIGQTPVTIVGVVKDNSPLASHAFGEIFMPVIEEEHSWGDDFFGDLSVALLREPGSDVEKIKEQVKGRYASLATEMKPSGLEPVYHEQPYDQELSTMTMGSNTTPSTESDHKRTIMLMLILLLVPAINMSALTQSRLKKRTAEIGVKRAYGATKSRIVSEILAENFIVTLAGGAIGLLLSMAGAWLMSDTVFAGMGDESGRMSMELPLKAVLNWKVFGFALVSCFVLNLLSAGIPAWRASRVHPVEALKG